MDWLFRDWTSSFKVGIGKILFRFRILISSIWWGCSKCCIEAETNGRHFPDDIFTCIFLNENVWISIKIPAKFVPKGPINNIPALFQIMAWRRSGDKPLSETMMFTLLTHICVTRPQWVKISGISPIMAFKLLVEAWNMGWKFLSIPKLQRWNRWSLGMDK